MEGNYIGLLCEFESKDIVINCVYGPSGDEPAFISKIFENSTNFNTTHQIFLGDFNVTPCHNKDNINYVEPRSQRSRAKLNSLMESNMVIDSYRQLNPNGKMYTWARTNGRQKARLDLSLITQGLRPYLINCEKLTSFQSDHSPLKTVLDFSKFRKGKGCWKFCDNLLKDGEFVQMINKCIKTTCAKYVDLMGFDNFYTEASNDEFIAFMELDIEEIQSFIYKINPNLLLEMILNDCRNSIISYSIGKKRGENNEEKELETEIKNLEKAILLANDYNIDLEDALSQKNIEYQEFMQRKAYNFLQNNKISHKIGGEKATKFFCSLQKNYAAQKYIPSLKVIRDGAEIVITDQKEIENEQYNYYKTLFSDNDEFLTIFTPEEFLNVDNENVPKLTEQQKNDIEGEMLIEELTSVLKNCNNDSSPGPSGFTYKFYKMFWGSLKYFLLKCANYSLEQESLPSILTQGLISLLPKGDKPKDLLRNWRPITLLNVGYKLISSVLSKRISSSLEKIINRDQVGFVKNRYIGESSRTTYDLLHYAKSKRLTYLLLILDFEKAFDSVLSLYNRIYAFL